MAVLLSFVVAVLFGVGIYLLLQKDLLRAVLAVLILSNAANLFIFVAGGVDSRQAPLINADEETLSKFASDPIPQALILTAIVIGFGVIAYFLVLSKEFFKKEQQHDLNKVEGPEIS